MDFSDSRLPLAGLQIRYGTVLSVGTGICRVRVAGVAFNALVPNGITVEVGDVVPLYPGRSRPRTGRSHWVGVYCGVPLFNAPEETGANDPVPNPRPEVVTGRLVVAPVETRTRRDGKWRRDTADVFQGEYGSTGNNTGCAFYGRKPRSLKGVTVTRARLKVRRLRGGTFASQTTTLRLVEEATRPSGAPTLLSSTTGPALAVGKRTSTFAVPTSWVQDMITGDAGGLAIYDADGSPYVRLAGRGQWSPAFTLTIDWRRT